VAIFANLLNMMAIFEVYPKIIIRTWTPDVDEEGGSLYPVVGLYDLKGSGANPHRDKVKYPIVRDTTLGAANNVSNNAYLSLPTLPD
jgi:hypothetical protein